MARPLLAAVRADLAWPRLWRNGLLVVLFSLYPLVFTLSRNWFTLTLEQVGILFLLVPTACLAVYAVSSVFLTCLLHLWRHLRKTQPGWGDPLAFSAVCVAAAAVYVLMHATLLAVFDKEYWVILILISLGGIFYILLMRNLSFPVLLLGAALVSVAGVEWAYNYISEDSAVAKASEIAENTGLSGKDRDFTFTDTPNIYLLVYDAYGNKQALEDLYDFDNSEFYDYLQNKDFITIHDSFANYRLTWPTMLAVFLGDHHYYSIGRGADDTSVGRLIMNGTATNPALLILKENGYKIQYINMGNYFGGEKGSIDYFFPVVQLLNAFDVFDSPYLKFLHVRMDSKEERWRRQRETLDQRISFVAQDDQPWFTFSYIYKPAHSKRKTSWKDLTGFEELHRDGLVDTNRHIRHVVERIQSADPDAFILLMGDHGAWRYRCVWEMPGAPCRPVTRVWGRKKKQDPNEAFRQNGVTVETVTLDVFGILMAVHTAGRCDRYIYDGISPVNLMRVTFSCLSGQDLPANLPKDDSYFSEFYRTVQQGEMLERWERNY
jgi:hypothetical protein